MPKTLKAVISYQKEACVAKKYKMYFNILYVIYWLKYNK